MHSGYGMQDYGKVLNLLLWHYMDIYWDNSLKGFYATDITLLAAVKP